MSIKIRIYHILTGKVEYTLEEGEIKRTLCGRRSKWHLFVFVSPSAYMERFRSEGFLHGRICKRCEKSANKRLIGGKA